jgi:hypothetical protein
MPLVILSHSTVLLWDAGEGESGAQGIIDGV